MYTAEFRTDYKECGGVYGIKPIWLPIPIPVGHLVSSDALIHLRKSVFLICIITEAPTKNLSFVVLFRAV